MPSRILVRCTELAILESEAGAMIQLLGQRILVVGGTAGIGRAIAEDTVAAGAEVEVVGRSTERAVSVAAEIKANHGHGADVTDETQARELFAAVGVVDHLVITAANLHNALFAGDDAIARKSFEGKFWLQHRCARLAQVRGSILMFSGTFSRRPMNGVSALAAANGAVEALGRALAVELAPVRVNVIAPGLVQGTEAFAGIPAEALSTMVAAATARLPTGLVGDARSLSVVAMAMLASPYMTGSVVTVDGGGMLV